MPLEEVISFLSSGRQNSPGTIIFQLVVRNSINTIDIVLIPFGIVASEERYFGTCQPLLCLQHVQLCQCVTCQGSSYTKNEHSLFYQKFDAEYFFIQQFFRKKLYFQRKLQKTVLEAHLTIF